MITGEIRSQVDAVWDHLWTNGLSNPLDAIEQITFLLFLKRLDEEEQRNEAATARTGKLAFEPLFKPRDYEDKVKTKPLVGGQLCRWSRFKQLDPATMYDAVSSAAFPFLKSLGGKESSYAAHMADATFKVPARGGVLHRAVDMLDKIRMDDRDTKGDVYEYLINKLEQAGLNGQFRTPRHVIKMMVELVAPTPDDTFCDPACGTAGFLVYAGEYLRAHNPQLLLKDKTRNHFLNDMFHGFDNDAGRTMHRIAAMNLMLHGIENPRIEYHNALARPSKMGSMSVSISGISARLASQFLIFSLCTGTLARSNRRIRFHGLQESPSCGPGSGWVATSERIAADAFFWQSQLASVFIKRFTHAST